MNDPLRLEKLGLLAIAALIVVALLLICIIAISHGLNSEVATLIGVVVTGLIAYGKDIVQAIRGYSMSAQLAKVTDQLAASAPTVSPPAPQSAVDAAQDVAEAAAARADQVAGS